MTSAECKKETARLLARDYELWDACVPTALDDAERSLASEAASETYLGPNAPELAAACQCFYLFRRLHQMADVGPETATLLGDYYFSRFSNYLIALDSVPLTDSFAEYLVSDALVPADSGTYISFVRSISAVLCHENS